MNYIIDSGHTAVVFAVRHLMIATVRGSFGGATGTATFDLANPETATVDVVIDVNSLTTHNPQRDSDLKGSEFLDTSNYPTLTFKSTKVEKFGEATYAITGDLTIHGITKEVVLAAEYQGETKDMFGNIRIAFSAETSINRKDFGIIWNRTLESGGVVIGDKISITLDTELIQQPAGEITR